MTTWVLIFYMSTGFGTVATGGPAAIDGFTSYAACQEAGRTVGRLEKYDWHECVEVKK